MEQGTEGEAIELAVRIAGGPTALMNALNQRGHRVNGRATVHQWIKNGVPGDYCPDIEDLTGVSCEKLRPSTNWALIRTKGKARAS